MRYLTVISICLLGIQISGDSNFAIIWGSVIAVATLRAWWDYAREYEE